MSPRGRRLVSDPGGRWAGGRWGLALAVAALGIASAGAPRAPDATGHPVSIPPAPPGKFLLVRELRHSLDDGNQIVTRRSYRIVIVGSGGGYLVDGELVDSVVEAPDRLAALADLERIRPDIGLFPIRLDSAGRITGISLQPYAPAVSGSVLAANAMLENRPIPQADRAAIVSVVTALASRAGDDAWPAELFRPGNGQRHDVQPVAVGAGNSGEVDETVHAVSSPAGWLRQLERRITTSTPGRSQETVERWTMAPLRQ